MCLGMQGHAFERTSFPLQGDRVIGVSNFNAMAEECITDQKVCLPLSTAGHIDFFFPFVLCSFCVSSLHHPPYILYPYIISSSQAVFFLQMLNFYIGVTALAQSFVCIEFCFLFFFQCLSNWLAIHLDPV